MKWQCKMCGTVFVSEQVPSSCSACGLDEFALVPHDSHCSKCGWEYYRDDAPTSCEKCGYVFGKKPTGKSHGQAATRSRSTSATSGHGGASTRGRVAHSPAPPYGRKAIVVGLVSFVLMWLSEYWGTKPSEPWWNNVIGLVTLLTFIGASINYVTEAKTDAQSRLGCIVPILMFAFMSWLTYQLGWWAVAEWAKNF